MQDFRKLMAWEKAHALTLDVYRATSRFPREERFALTDQLRRSTASIPTNIAELKKMLNSLGSKLTTNN